MSEELSLTENQKTRLEQLSPMVKEVLNAINQEDFDTYKVVDIVEALSLSSGVLVTTSLDEEAVLRAEAEAEQMFNYLMRGLRTYVDKQNILHGSVLLGVIKTLGFLANYISQEELKNKAESVE